MGEYEGEEEDGEEDGEESDENDHNVFYKASELIVSRIGWRKLLQKVLQFLFVLVELILI